MSSTDYNELMEELQQIEDTLRKLANNPIADPQANLANKRALQLKREHLISTIQLEFPDWKLGEGLPTAKASKKK